MREVILRKGEARLEVFLEEGSGLDSSEDGSIDGDLLFDTLGVGDVLLSLLFQESIGRLGGLILGGLEAGVAQIGGHDYLADIDHGGGGNEISLVHTSQGNSVQLEGTYSVSACCITI